MAHLTVEQSEQAGKRVITAVGEIDLASTPDLEAHLNDAALAGPVIVDLAKVSFIDSTGLRVLLSAHRAAESAGHGLALIVTEGPVTKLLSITGVDGHFNVFGSLAAAIADD